MFVRKKCWSKKQFWSKKSKVLIKLNTSKLSLVATKHSRKLQVLLEFDTEGPSLVIVLYDWQQSLWPLYTHRPTFGLIKATCRCLKSINVDWLPNDIRRASIDRPSLTPTTHPWPDHTLPYPTSHNQIIKSLLIYLNILIFRKFLQTDRPTDQPTDICPYRSDLPSLKKKSVSLLSCMYIASALKMYWLSVQCSCTLTS